MFADIDPLAVAKISSSVVVIPRVVFAPAMLVAEFIKIFPASDAEEIGIVIAPPGFVMLKLFKIKELVLVATAARSAVNFTFAFAV
jgi:hypothetical protein